MSSDSRWNNTHHYLDSDVSRLSDSDVLSLCEQVEGHRDAGEEEMFLSRGELASLLSEVVEHRRGTCPNCSRAHVVRECTWGYDG